MKKYRIATFFAVFALISGCLAHTPASTPTPFKSLGLIFSGPIPDEKNVFAINNAERGIPTQFTKLGDKIPNTEYIIIGYSALPKKPILIIEHKFTHAKVQLVLREVTWVDP